MSKVYITTAIPYVNGDPHIGHALDYLNADVMARYHKNKGDEVRFQTGTDEHGNKIFQKAAAKNLDVKDYVDQTAAVFKEFIEKLNVKSTDFIRTTDEAHMRRCQAIWQKLAPHIYASRYDGWYCSGCEGYVTNKEYAENDGVCPDHQKPYEKLSEENYYFRIADFKDRIKTAIETDEMKILPDFRKKEILKLLEDSPDVSISRPKSQLTWGVEVPTDNNQVMYVWIDALSNYITVLGYPEQEINEWWPAAAQFVGKDILRFHAIIWPAMLMGLGLPLPKVICSHGFVLADGQKMSKSIGNVVNPLDVLEKHGVEALRYYFLRHIDSFADSDFTWEKFENAYNNELANDLGNLVQRLATMAAKNGIKQIELSQIADAKYDELMNNFAFSNALDYVWEKVQAINKRIDDEKPWMLAKAGETKKLNTCLTSLIEDLLNVNQMLEPFLPGTAEKIDEVFKGQGEIVPPATPLFPKN